MREPPDGGFFLFTRFYTRRLSRIFANLIMEQ